MGQVASTWGVSEPPFSKNTPQGARRLHCFGPTCTSHGHSTMWFPGSRATGAGSSRLFMVPVCSLVSFLVKWRNASSVHKALGYPSRGLSFKFSNTSCVVKLFTDCEPKVLVLIHHSNILQGLLQQDCISRNTIRCYLQPISVQECW